MEQAWTQTAGFGFVVSICLLIHDDPAIIEKVPISAPTQSRQLDIKL
jgi:hypothetical protein